MQDFKSYQANNGGGGIITYFFAKRGLHTRDILNDKADLLLYQKSDFVIIQAGIVDASRRIMKRGLEWRIEFLPILLASSIKSLLLLLGLNSRVYTITIMYLPQTFIAMS